MAGMFRVMRSSSSSLRLRGRLSATEDHQPHSSEDEEEVQKKEARLKMFFMDIAENKWVTGVNIFFTVFALYGADVWELLGPPPISADPVLHTMSMLVFLFFCVEFAVLTRCKDKYKFSFFFWLDLLATISLIPDVILLFKVDVWSIGGSSGDQVVITRIFRAARAGTRTVRIVRVIRLITLSRSGKTQGGNTESKIGGLLAIGITHKIIIIVGLMLLNSSLLDLLDNHAVDFALPLRSLESLLLKCGNNSAVVAAGGRAKLCSNHSASCVDAASDSACCAFDLFLRETLVDHNGDFGMLDGDRSCSHANGYTSVEQKEKCKHEEVARQYNFDSYSFSGDCSRQTLRFLRVLGEDVFCSNSSFADLRTTPVELVDSEVCAGSPNGVDCKDAPHASRLVLENLTGARAEALLNIAQVTCIVVLLGISSFLFQRDANRLVIRPLAKMARLVQNLSHNPLEKLEQAEGGELETDFVERALQKFGQMLQIAFGEAGSEIIGKSLGADGDLNPMMAGRKMTAVFGFSIVRNFADCTECLQEDVMVFVNTIAAIVHRAVKDTGGAPNKNIGEAFLMAWRITEPPPTPALQQSHSFGSDREDSEGDPASQRDGREPTVADRALQSFVRACLEVQAAEDLRKLTEHPKMQERLPGYRTTMGFGLHVGWAIEGAIGSMLKIDASYLSPNVNLAARLESATEQFEVDILMSEKFADMLSPQVRALCRAVDRVTVKGSSEPMLIYTYDVPHSMATSMFELEPLAGIDFWDQFRPSTTPLYREDYGQAVQLYLEGNWAEALPIIEGCLVQWPEDGPALVLKTVMEKNSCQPPPDWKGFRELTNK
eukprot:CAMPEP_0180265342 /NCGR_PEP_ID=MMETSP0988-20121125/393_1 /TAXON_ID=697907 /ORGANISM="non described non described, Strain CCMP2293" /LENGTH=831 /DNA_ID=CAMNT_0022235805 /DNA_START=33 /DNA_END=2528 /DNA_ORIENTATION=+